MDFGNTLKHLRSELNMTQEALANTINVSRPTIARYETNERFPDKEILITLSKIFNVSVDYLLGITNIRYSVEYLIKRGAIKVKELPEEVFDMLR